MDSSSFSESLSLLLHIWIDTIVITLYILHYYYFYYYYIGMPLYGIGERVFCRRGRHISCNEGAHMNKFNRHLTVIPNHKTSKPIVWALYFETNRKLWQGKNKMNIQGARKSYIFKWKIGIRYDTIRLFHWYSSTSSFFFRFFIVVFIFACKMWKVKFWQV